MKFYGKLMQYIIWVAIYNEQNNFAPFSRPWYHKGSLAVQIITFAWISLPTKGKWSQRKRKQVCFISGERPDKLHYQKSLLENVSKRWGQGFVGSFLALKASWGWWVKSAAGNCRQDAETQRQIWPGVNFGYWHPWW